MERCCSNCYYNMKGNCTVIPGTWNNIIPDNIVNKYHCRYHKFNSEMNNKPTKLVEDVIGGNGDEK